MKDVLSSATDATYKVMNFINAWHVIINFCLSVVLCAKMVRVTLNDSFQVSESKYLKYK